MKASISKPLLLIILFAIIGLIFSIRFFWPKKEPAATKVTKENTFVGSNTCFDCHSKEYSDWSDSHHDWAMKIPTDETVLGDFNNSTFSADQESYRFTKENGKFIVENQSSKGESQEYEIAYTFGVYPLQQYLVLFPDGKYQTLRVSWDSEKNLWFHQYPGQFIEQNDWLHWTQGGQRWNTMCADCHSTNLQKNYDRETDVFNTTFSEINVACESCHGPSSNHAQWQGDGSFPNVLKGSTQKEQVNVCGPCHARRVKLGNHMNPAQDFSNQFLLQNISSDYYHGDGQIKEEDYVLGSFMQSKMFHNDVKCTDCHNPHSLKLKFEGNALCVQCHESKYDSKEHHFHEINTKQSQCINCHMTGQYFMGNDFRRDHSFRIPRPDQSVDHKTPNACINCHSNQSNEWAAKSIVQWYGTDRKTNYSDKLLVLLEDKISREAYQSILSFLSKQDEPALARATALEYLNFSFSEQEVIVLLENLKDPNPIVRYNAILKFDRLTKEEKESIARRHINDKNRLVRIGAARLLLDSDIESFPASERQSIRNAINDYEKMLFQNADFPVGRMQLGDYYLRKNRLADAIYQYEMALKMDDKLIPVYSNLATAYNMNNENEKSLSTLNNWIQLDGNDARAYYLRALLYYEIGQKIEALSDLKRATDIDPENERYLKNYQQISNELLGS